MVMLKFWVGRMMTLPNCERYHQILATAQPYL